MSESGCRASAPGKKQEEDEEEEAGSRAGPAMARRKKQPAVLLLEEDEEDEEDKCEGGGASDADEEEDGSVVSRVLEVIGTIGKYKRRREGVRHRQRRSKLRGSIFFCSYLRIVSKLKLLH